MQLIHTLPHHSWCQWFRKRSHSRSNTTFYRTLGHQLRFHLSKISFLLPLQSCSWWHLQAICRLHFHFKKHLQFSSNSKKLKSKRLLPLSQVIDLSPSECLAVIEG